LSGGIALTVLGWWVFADEVFSGVTVGAGESVTRDAAESTGGADVDVEPCSGGAGADIVQGDEAFGAIAELAGGSVDTGRASDHTGLALVGGVFEVCGFTLADLAGEDPVVYGITSCAGGSVFAD
jgi:hypothetical protein